MKQEKKKQKKNQSPNKRPHSPKVQNTQWIKRENMKPKT